MSVESYAYIDEPHEDTSYSIDTVETVDQSDVWNDGQDIVRAYLNQIGKIALLNAAEEVELAKQIEAGLYAQKLLDRQQDDSEGMLQIIAREGERAKDHMIRANLRLVVSMAKRYNSKGVPLIDMIQDGNMGLMHAVEMFDYKKGFKFSTYATWWIRQAITRRTWEQSQTIRLPNYVTEKIMNIAKIRRDIMQNTGHTATDDEIAARMNIPVAELQKLYSYGRDLVSLDAVLSDDRDGATAGELLVDEFAPAVHDIYENHHRREVFDTAFEQIDPREARIIRMRLGWDDGVPRTLEEVAAAEGISRSRVSQIELRGMRKLRQPEIREGLRDLLD